MFVAYVGICQLLGDITQHLRRQDLTQQRRQVFENALYRWIKELPSELRLFNAGERKALRSYSFLARQLMVPYFVILIILFRNPYAEGPPSVAAIVASSFVAGIYEDFMNRDELRFLGPVFTFYALAAGLPQISGLRLPTLRAEVEAELSIMNLALGELSKRWGSANGIIKALATARASVERKAPLPVPTTRLAQSAQPFFSDFGPELCRQWYLTGDEKSIGATTATSLSPVHMRSSQVSELPTLPTMADPSIFAADPAMQDLDVIDQYDPLECLLLGENFIDFSF